MLIVWFLLACFPGGIDEPIMMMGIDRREMHDGARGSSEKRGRWEGKGGGGERERKKGQDEERKIGSSVKREEEKQSYTDRKTIRGSEEECEKVVCDRRRRK